MTRSPKHVGLTSDLMQVTASYPRTYWSKGEKVIIQIPVSTGFQKGFLQLQQLHMLKKIVLFLLQQQVISRPDMYSHFERLQDRDGSMGREILLYTLFHEPPSVIEMAYEIISRVQYKTIIKANAKSQKELIDKISNNKIEEGVATEANEVDTEIIYKKVIDILRQSPSTEQGRQSQFFKLPKQSRTDYRPIDIHGQLSTVHNDSEVYATYPTRLVKGMWDHGLNDIQPLCGSSISSFFSKTAKADGPENFKYADEREQLSVFRREICMYKPSDIDIEDIIAKRLDKTFYDKPMPDNEPQAKLEAELEAKRISDYRTKMDAKYALEKTNKAKEDVPTEDVSTEDVPTEDVLTEDVPKEDVSTQDVPTEDVVV